MFTQGKYLVLLLLFLCICLAGCTAEEESLQVILPAAVEERLALPGDSAPANTDSVSLFFDNTWSVSGFFRDGQLRLPLDQRADGIFGMSFIRALKDALDGSVTAYALAENSAGTLSWQTREGLFDACFQESFYVDAALLPKSGGLYLDPLRMLTDGDSAPFRPEGVNVIVTDLSSQNSGHLDFADYLAETVFPQKGYAASVVAIRSDYHGLVSAPASDRANKLNGSLYHGDRPLYVIITGPLASVDRLEEALCRALEDCGLVRGLPEEGQSTRSYWTYRCFENLQLDSVTSLSAIVHGAAATLDREDAGSDGGEDWLEANWSTIRFQGAVCMEKLENTPLHEMLGRDTQANILGYRYSPSMSHAYGSGGLLDSTTEQIDRAVVNLYIPLEGYSPDGETQYVVGFGNDPASLTPGSGELEVSLCSPRTETGALGEALAELEPVRVFVGNYTDAGGDDPQRALTNWQETDGNTIGVMTDGKIRVWASIITGGDVMTTDAAAAEQIGGNYLNSFLDNGEGSQSAREQMTVAALDGGCYWLRLTVEFPKISSEGFGWDGCLLSIPIYTSQLVEVELPAWGSALSHSMTGDPFSGEMSEGDQLAYFSGTYKLEEFLEACSGLGRLRDGTVFEMEQRQELTVVNLLVCDLAQK